MCRSTGNLHWADSSLSSGEIFANTSAAGLTWTDISTLALSVFLVLIFAFTGKKLAELLEPRWLRIGGY